jgi:predicted protein tyrosine phosphatase
MTTLTRNRRANLGNEFQGQSKRVLCVCSAGMLRSPTAAWVLSNDPWNFNTRSCGTEDHALVPLDLGLLLWADEVVCMDSRQAKVVREMLDSDSTTRPVHVLNVPDNYNFRDPELVDLLKEKFSWVAWLNKENAV